MVAIPLMFIIGLHLDTSALKQGMASIFVVGVVATIGVAVTIAYVRRRRRRAA